MFKERSSAAPILQKASSLLKVPIMIVSRRMRKPVIPRIIISLKKSRKKMLFSSRRSQYNYGYQFSPSCSSPLIQYHFNRKPLKKKNRYGSDLYSMAFLGKCLGMTKEKAGHRSSGFSSSNNVFMSYGPRPLMEVNALPSTDDQNTLVSSSSSSSGGFCGGELDDSIDERAEKFIERFYEEMRLQRQDSFLSF